jgi:hypothetical protein
MPAGVDGRSKSTFHLFNLGVRSFPGSHTWETITLKMNEMLDEFGITCGSTDASRVTLYDVDDEDDDIVVHENDGADDHESE